MRNPLDRAWRGLIVTVLGFALLGHADSDASEPVGEPAVKYRQIFIPRRHESKLIPPDYEPISRSDFAAAFNLVTEQGVESSEEPRLVRTVLMAKLDRNALRSIGQSFFEFEYNDDTQGQTTLAPVNLAFSPSTSDVNQQLASTLDGKLLASVDGSQRIPFQWSLRGTAVADDQVQFELALPPSASSILYVVVPNPFTLDANNASVRRLAGEEVPNELRDRSSSDTVFLVELSGHERFSLLVKQPDIAPQVSQVVIREAYGKYRLQADGIAWEYRFDFTWPRGNGPLQFVVPDGTSVTSMVLDAVEQSFTQAITQDANLVSLSQAITDERDSINHRLEIRGISRPPDPGWFTLPTVRWYRANAIVSGTESLMRLTCAYPTELVDVDASDWKMTSSTESESESSHQFVAGRWDLPLRIITKRSDAYASANDTLRLDIGNDVLDATWNGVVEYDAGLVDSAFPSQEFVVGPLALELEDGWEISAATIVRSGRELDLSTGTVNRLQIWPEPGEIVGRKLHVRVKGQRRLPTGDQVTIPRSFFVRWQSIDSERVAMISTSSRIRFYGISEIQNRRISDKQLSAEATGFLGEPGGTVCYLDLEDGSVPSFKFDRASSQFDARLEVGVLAVGNRFLETFSIATENVTGRLNRLDIRFPKSSETSIGWVVRDINAVSGESSRRSSVQATRKKTEDDAEIWRLELGEPLDEGKVLVGKRMIEGPAATVNLPSVPRALHQRGTLRTGPNVELVSVSPNIVRIPEPRPARSDQWKTILRYDPTVDGLVSIESSRPSVKLPIVTSEEISVVSDLSGRDSVFVELNVAASGSVVMRHAAELQFHKAIESGLELPPEDVQVAPGQVTCNVASSEQTIVLVFSADRDVNPWGRAWKMPHLACDNAVLKSRTTRFLGTGAVVLDWRSLWGLPVTNVIGAPSYISDLGVLHTRGAGQVVGPEDAMWLVPSGVRMGLQFGLSLVLFILGWRIGLPRMVGTAGFIVLVAISFGTAWDWGFQWVFNPLLPFAVGVVFAFLLRRYRVLRAMPDASIVRQGSQTYLLRGSILFWAVMLGSFDSSVAQDDVPETFSLMIPLNDDGSQSKNMYIPSTLYDRLVGENPTTKVRNSPAILSARYVVDLRADPFVSNNESTRLQAVYSLSNSREDSTVLMPLPPQFRKYIRRIDLSVGGETIPIRWPQPQADGGIHLQMSGRPTGTVRFLLSVPTPTDASRTRALQLNVPPVLNSQLIVNYDGEVRNVQSLTGLGATTDAVATNSLSVDLGSVDRLHLNWQQHDTGRSAIPLNTRRLWYLRLSPSNISRGSASFPATWWQRTRTNSIEHRVNRSTDGYIQRMGS